MHWLEFDPSKDFKLLFLALMLPLVGYVIQIFVGRSLPRRGDWLLTGGMFVSMCITVLMFAKSLYAAYHGIEFRHHSGEEAGLWFHWAYSSDAAAAGAEQIKAAIFYDPLGAAMLAVVGVVSFCVHLFSIGYMATDKRYHIFFANISLFTFAMLGLTLSDNILFLFVFWELMGCMSYLLIGHFSHDPSSGFFHNWATWACKKAFLTTRVGDVCLFIGILIFWQHFHTLRFTELWRLGHEEVARHNGEFPQWMTVGGLFIFGGTVGKSAQFPLHIWLPDAMAGPTPVSAMIHAATMVAAGVFLLGRTFPLMSPEALSVIAATGTFTALFAATIGTTQNDIKAVLAYSTISQLGFMVAAVGLGGVVAGMFHMVTHAFFKACLFLSAGSVIHGCHHEQDMRNMGGLRKKMPITFVCMLVSTIAISGIPLFSGFYSKDMIIVRAWESVVGGHFTGASFFAAVALPLAAMLTAFYMFRLIFMTFFGEYRPGTVVSVFAHDQHGAHAAHDEHAGHGDHGHAAHGHAVHGAAAEHHHGYGEVHTEAAADHRAITHEDEVREPHAVPPHTEHDPHVAHEPHESPWTIVVALCVLATLGVVGGHFWLADPLGSLAFWNEPHTWFQQSATLETLYGAAAPVEAAISHHDAHTAHVIGLTISLCVALAGIALAYAIYGKGWARSQRIAGQITGTLGIVYETVAHKYYIDEVVDRSAIKGSLLVSKSLSFFDKHIVDGVVNLAGRIGRGLGTASAAFDRVVVDGAVNGVGLTTQTFGSVVRLFQSGRVQQYATFAVFGGLGLAVWLILL